MGSFMIRGKKNFLPPHPLIMGFGLLFRLDESSLGSHLNERRVRGEEEGINDFEESGPPQEISDSESEKSVTDKELVLESKNVTVDLNAEVEDPLKFLPQDATISEINKEDTSNIVGNSYGVASVTPQLEDLIDRALGLGPAAVSQKHYGVETSQVNMSEDHGSEEWKATGRDKPHISKAERRKLKKGHKNGAGDANVELENEESKETVVSVSQPEKSVQNSKVIGGKISRGQKGKLKKMKEKYANQDEEERSIRMALLAVSTRTSTFIILQNSDIFFYHIQGICVPRNINFLF